VLPPAPRPRLGQGERPQAQVERPDAGPHEPHLLLPRPHHLLAIAERGLQAEAVGDAAQDIRRRGPRVGAEVRPPPRRLVHQHHPPPPPPRPPPPPGSPRRPGARSPGTSCPAWPSACRTG